MIDPSYNDLSNREPEYIDNPGFERPNKRDHWVPACGGTELPFKTRTGRILHYLWNQKTGEHAYYDCQRDVFLTHEEADEALSIH